MALTSAAYSDAAADPPIPAYSFRPLAYQSADPNDPRVRVDAGEKAPQKQLRSGMSGVAATWQTKTGTFPIGVGWEVNETNAARWNYHKFASLLGSSRLELFTRRGVDANELHLLRLDILAWNDLANRRLTNKTLEEHLRAGREHWGSLVSLFAMQDAAGLDPWDDDGDDEFDDDEDLNDED